MIQEVNGVRVANSYGQAGKVGGMRSGQVVARASNQDDQHPAVQNSAASSRQPKPRLEATLSPFARVGSVSYPAAMYQSIRSVGLVGDGDEIDAIEAVERAFGIKLPSADAQSWVTAGDLFTAVRRHLPNSAMPEPLLWSRFAAALAEDNGMDPRSIRPESPMLFLPSEKSSVARVLQRLAIAILLGLVLLVVAWTF